MQLLAEREAGGRPTGSMAKLIGMALIALSAVVVRFRMSGSFL